MKLVLSVHSAAPHSPLSSVSNGVLRWLETGQTLIVGRSPQRAEMSIPHDGMLSQVHFQIECGDQSCTLQDLNSTNGTRLNGQPIQSAELFDGDCIEAGQSSFAISLPDGPQRPESARPVAEATTNESQYVDAPAEPPIIPRHDSDSFAATSIQLSGTTIDPIQAGADPPINSSPSQQASFDTESIESKPSEAKQVALSVERTPTSKGAAELPTRDTWVPDGWAIELTGWPELALLVEIEDIREEMAAAVEPRDYAATSVTISVYDPHQESISPLASRAVTWIGAGQSLVVGRSAHHADWALPHDHYLSSRHFRITCEQGRCIVENLSQTNGTWFHRQQVERALLRDGDFIFAGETTFQVSVQSGAPISDVEYQAEMILAQGSARK